MSNNIRSFHRVTADRLKMFKQKAMKKRSETKMWWGVRAYQQWRSNRLSDSEQYDSRIFDANLDSLACVTKVNLEHALCVFIAEVKKVNGDEYPGCTLYQLAVSIQKYLNENGLNWKLIDGPDFKQFRVVLDNLMKERALQNIGMVRHQAQLIPHDFETSLWEKRILGEHNPDILRNTVLFLIGINCTLRAGDEHHDLRRSTSTKPSQFSFERNDKGERCLVYRENTVTETNDGGLAHMHKECKIVWVYPSQNLSRCPVRLVDKYISFCPEVGPKQKPNFYLRSLDKINPAQWYSSRVVRINTLRKTVGSVLKDAKLDGFFTNHSLQRSGTTRLFQAGVDRKIVKEFTLHASDAVDKYQITSDDQRRQISNVISGESVKKSVEKEPSKVSIEPNNNLEISIKDTGNSEGQCSCRKKVKLSESDQIGRIVSNVLEGRKYGKATIKLKIEFS